MFQRAVPVSLIVGQRVALRWIEERDLSEIQFFGPGGDDTQLRIAFFETGLYSPQEGALAIESLADRRLIGTMQHFPPGPTLHGLELAYGIHRVEDRGRGLGSEALSLFSELLFLEQPHCHRHQLIVGTDNIASWKVAERSGFRREGLLRSAADADRADSYLYARTRADWVSGA
jgi:RimJ/RimL family protein N-acetyltransferase